jgi:hypothetical protein
VRVYEEGLGAYFPISVVEDSHSAAPGFAMLAYTDSQPGTGSQGMGEPDYGGYDSMIFKTCYNGCAPLVFNYSYTNPADTTVDHAPGHAGVDAALTTKVVGNDTLFDTGLGDDKSMSATGVDLTSILGWTHDNTHAGIPTANDPSVSPSVTHMCVSVRFVVYYFCCMCVVAPYVLRNTK